MNPATVDAILSLTTTPVIAIDDHGIITYANSLFSQTYGWTEDDLLGNPVTTIMPEAMRSAHTIGFSRFLATEQSTVSGQPLPLAVLYKDGRVEDAEHFILGEKQTGRWRFAATIKPR